MNFKQIKLMKLTFRKIQTYDTKMSFLSSLTCQSRALKVGWVVQLHIWYHCQKVFESHLINLRPFHVCTYRGLGTPLCGVLRRFARALEFGGHWDLSFLSEVVAQI